MSPAPERAGQPRRASRWRQARLIVVVAVFVLGVYLGRSIAYELSIGGESILGASVLAGLALVGAAAASIVWPVVARLSGRSVGRALASVGLSTAALAVGAVAGTGTAGLTGATYHPPITLEAPATIQSDLFGPGLAVALADGTAGRCTSEPDSRRIASVTALDLGAFGSGRLRGFLVFAGDGSVDGWALIDGTDVDPEVLPIRWAGALHVMSISADRSSGDVFFPDVPLAVDAKLPDATIGPEWPRTIAGDISWQCQPFED